LNKILVTIQGKTLILYYQIKFALSHANLKLSAYIYILPPDDLSRFDLKGLTPEMFCVNIADMVNMRGVFRGKVENEKQMPVARWEMNREEYLEASRQPLANLTHLQIVQILANMPDYVRESDDQYIDFEECIITHTDVNNSVCSGYQLTIMTENIDGDIQSRAYFKLNKYSEGKWLESIPASTDFAAIHSAVNKKLQAIMEAGVKISSVQDETDYALIE
jgi:hypothetical protein